MSPNFTYAELTISSVRKDNTPPPNILQRIESILAPGCEEIKKYLDGKSVLINSGYRSPEVNKAIGGSKTSAHCLGYAVDFISPKYGTPIQVAERLSETLKKFDQIIYEGTWVHASFDPRNRKQVLTKTKGGYVKGIV